MDKKQPKKIVITGITSGIGNALFQQFYQDGHLIAGCGLSNSNIPELQKKYPNALFDEVNVASCEQVSNWATQVVAKIGAPDFLINNAGIINNPAPLWEIPAIEFTQLININVIGYWNVIKGFVPAMITQNSGVIVNLSSGWGHRGAALYGPYSISKFAIEGLSQSLAAELPPSLASITLDPGTIKTPLLRIVTEEDAKIAQDPVLWAAEAAPFILKLDQKDNGKCLKAPKISE